MKLNDLLTRLIEAGVDIREVSYFPAMYREVAVRDILRFHGGVLSVKVSDTGARMDIGSLFLHTEFKVTLKRLNRIRVKNPRPVLILENE